MCGKIQCQSSAKKPQGTNTVSIDTTIRFNGREVKCRGTYMYTAKDDEEARSDPGLVMTGTKCGDGMVSWGFLREITSLVLVSAPVWTVTILYVITRPPSMVSTTFTGIARMISQL